jgi:hypothetical protein
MLPFLGYRWDEVLTGSRDYSGEALQTIGTWLFKMLYHNFS